MSGLYFHATNTGTLKNLKNTDNYLYGSDHLKSLNIEHFRERGNTAVSVFKFDKNSLKNHLGTATAYGVQSALKYNGVFDIYANLKNPIIAYDLGVSVKEDVFVLVLECLNTDRVPNREMEDGELKFKKAKVVGILNFGDNFKERDQKWSDNLDDVQYFDYPNKNSSN